MTANDILEEIKPLGRESYRKVLANHGITGPCYGVKIEELKKIQKRIRKDHRLALDLYDTGIYDAMYLAGLIADDAAMTQKDLDRWVAKANDALAGCTVAWVAAGSPHARALALEWIESKRETTAVAGWATLSGLVSITDDAFLDLAELKRLLHSVAHTIHTAPNRVRYAMNAFVIAVGCYVKSLTKHALQIGEQIGPVSVDMGNTSCQVPSAPAIIRKVEARGTLGQKRKTAKC